jgi:hypothetical protein
VGNVYAEITVTNKSDIIEASKGHIAEKDVRSVTIWKDRTATVDPIAFPDGKPLLGVIPLEILDLIVDPVRHELVGAHGDEVVLTVM